LPAAVLVRGILTFAFFGAGAYLPLALVTVRGTSATEAGLALTAATLSWTVGSWIQASRNEAWGGRRLVGLGFALVAVSIVTVSTILLPGVPIVVAAVAWAIGGFGMGLAYSSLSLLVLRDAPVGEQGAATAGLQLSDVLGTSLGTGLGGAIVGFATLSGLSAGSGIGAAFGVSAAVAALGVLISRRLAGRRPGAPASGAATEPQTGCPKGRSQGICQVVGAEARDLGRPRPYGKRRDEQP
jgi:MFS family permease